MVGNYAESVAEAFKVPAQMVASSMNTTRERRPELACLADLEAAEAAPTDYLTHLQAAARFGSAYVLPCTTGMHWKDRPVTGDRQLLRHQFTWTN